MLKFLIKYIYFFYVIYASYCSNNKVKKKYCICVFMAVNVYAFEVFIWKECVKTLLKSGFLIQWKLMKKIFFYLF